MAYAGSNGAKMKFVGGAVFAKFWLFSPKIAILLITPKVLQLGG